VLALPSAFASAQTRPPSAEPGSYFVRVSPLLVFFEQHPRYAVGALLICAIQLALIAGLVVQRARRRRAEEESRTNEERYRNVVETQSELICRFLPDTTLTFVNDAYCRFWNKSRDELLGTRFIELIPKSSHEKVLERIGRLVSGTDSHEHAVTLADGTIGWLHWINHAILDHQGRLAELQGVGRDITDRRRIEDALAESEARNSAMLRAVPDLMFVLRRDGTYIDYHARETKLLFAPPSAFIGKCVRDIMPPDLAEMFMDAIERACLSDDPIVVEYELPLDDVRHFEARLVQADAGRVLCIVRDVTESKRVIERNQDLAGRLIASQEGERQRIARELHDDLSQKLALLNIKVDQVAARVGADDLRSRLQEISRHIGEIARDVHDLAYELHPSKLQILGLAPGIQSLCRDVSQHGELQVVFTHGNLPQDVDPHVSLCLYRITQEALHNVVRHSRATEAKVRLKRDADTLALQIADSGVGFDPKKARGAGLGLLSIRERVSFLKGELVIHAFPGQGTRIDVRIPLTARHAASTAPQSRADRGLNA
jgi:PAS domain S-box-containing protein